MSDGAAEVAIQNPARYADAGALELWTRKLLADVAPETSGFGLLLTDDDEMAQINGRFRSKPEATDVLSFPGTALGDAHSGAEADSDHGYLGDVVISVPTASRQSEAHDHSLERELKILVLHGILHCLGYDHEVDDGEMRRLEKDLIDRWVDQG